MVDEKEGRHWDGENEEGKAVERRGSMSVNKGV
jgi:hypothetical protein